MATMAALASAKAQSNVYSLSIYAGGLSTSPVWVLGSWPKQLGIMRESYWTDPNGYTVLWAGNARGVQPGDKEHVETKVVLGRVSLRVPLPPWAVGVSALAGMLTLAFAVVGHYTPGRNETDAPRVKS